MTRNREIFSFPFRPHLALFLFHTIENEVYETEVAYHKSLDIDLNSHDGKYLRVLLERADIPQVKTMKKGFRLTASVPKQVKTYRSLMHDGQVSALVITDEIAELINEYYESRFEDYFIAYVCGVVSGSKNSRGALTQAVQEFMDAYHLREAEGCTVDKMMKMYQRKKSPLKKGIYAKKKREKLKTLSVHP